MEERTHEQTAVVPDRHYHHPVNPYQHSSALLNALLCLCAFALLALIVVGVFQAPGQFKVAGYFLAWAFLGLSIVLTLLVISYQAYNKWHMDKIKRDHATKDLNAKDSQITSEQQIAEAEAERIKAEAELRRAEAETMRITVKFDDQGNAALRNPHTWQVVQLQGNMREHPNLTTLHYSQKVDALKGPGELAAIAAPISIAKPTIDEIVSQIARNSFEVGLGRSLDTKNIITAQLGDAHLKLIGGTRMGKSCEAGAILEQLSKTHDRQHLLFALLDLENKTSRLFADDPHVMTINTGMKNVRMHARTIEQVAEYLIMLHSMMIWRYTLSDAHLNSLPAVLIYLEEFLYWKRQLVNFVSKDMKEQALMAFSGLATRGLKANIHLMACAQVDYRDDELVEAMAQFIGINVAFAVKPDAARAAGFVSSDLLKRNYEARTPGQFVIEQVGGADIGMAPDFDVRSKLKLLEQGQTVVSEVAPIDEPELQPNYSRIEPRIELEPALQAKLEQWMENEGETMNVTIKRVWGASAGDNAKYKQAKEEYMQCQAYMHEMTRRALKGEA